jgi:hypothetical protein
MEYPQDDRFAVLEPKIRKFIGSLADSKSPEAIAEAILDTFGISVTVQYVEAVLRNFFATRDVLKLAPPEVLKQFMNPPPSDDPPPRER